MSTTASAAIEKLKNVKHNARDPNPWVALYLDSSVPLYEPVKASFLLDVSSRSRQFVFPLVRPFCRLFIALFKLLKTFIPNALTSSWLLRHSIYYGLRFFVSPHANYVIMRHFHVGSELLQFVATNTKGVKVELHPLRPKRLRDLVDDVFLQHDLNVYNFIIQLNRLAARIQVGKDAVQRDRQTAADEQFVRLLTENVRRVMCDPPVDCFGVEPTLFDQLEDVIDAHPHDVFQQLDALVQIDGSGG